MVVAASAGVDVANFMLKLSPSHVCITLAISFSLVTIGTVLTFSVLTIYTYRLIVHGLPEGISIFSAFLPLGALGLVSGHADQIECKTHSEDDGKDEDAEVEDDDASVISEGENTKSWKAKRTLRKSV